MTYYVLQLNPKAPQAWTFNVSWDGYWSGLGFTDDIKRAIRLPTKRDAYAAMRNHFVGLNGCMKVVKLTKELLNA